MSGLQSELVKFMVSPEYLATVSASWLRYLPDCGRRWAENIFYGQDLTNKNRKK